MSYLLPEQISELGRRRPETGFYLAAGVAVVVLVAVIALKDGLDWQTGGWGAR